MVLFAKIMVDEEDGFSRSLEELALKKATNNEIFRYVKIKFDEARKEENFHEQNVIDNFTGKRRFSDVDTSIEKLRRLQPTAEIRKTTSEVYQFETKMAGNIGQNQTWQWFKPK